MDAGLSRMDWTDAGIRFASVLGYSLPNFWVATLTVLVGSLWLPKLPILQYVPFTENPARNLVLLLVPSLVLSLTVLPLIVRMTRAAVLENLALDYVRTARAKGVGEVGVVGRHVLANSLIAVLNVAGVQIGVLIGGLVLTEEIFILPGLGRLLLQRALGLAAELGLPALSLAVTDGNPARRLYQTLGFRHVSTSLNVLVPPPRA